MATACRIGPVALLVWVLGPAAGLQATGEAAQEPTADPLTLADCYALALKQSEPIAIRRELIEETEGRFLQALSGALPRVSFSSSDKRQDASGESAFKLRDVPERKFVFSQPLFSGFKEFAAMAASRSERRQRMHEKARAEQLLFVDVADAFFLLLEHRGDLHALETIRLALLERLEELTERERLGRSRPSEVASATAQLRRIEADMQRVGGEETTARQLLEFLTGLARVGALAGDDWAIPPLSDEAAYLAKVEDRADLLAAEEAWHLAKYQVRVARAKAWPTVGLEGDYFTKRAGASEGVDWDVLLKVEVPLFQGGEAVGATREAASGARQAQLQLAETRRRAEREVRDAYVQVRAAIARRAALEQAHEAGEENYSLQVEDARLNLVSTLEVLRALEELQEVRRDLVHADAEAKRLYQRLRVAAGEPLSE